MKLQGAKSIAKAVLGLAAFSVLVSCAKDKSVNTDGIDKDQQAILKEDITGCEPTGATSKCIAESEYLLVRAIEASNGNNPFWAIPGFSTNFGSVKIRITEDRLEFLPSNDLQFAKYGYYSMMHRIVEKDEPIVSFPITKHFDIEYKKNDYGEETNKLVELEEGPKLARKYMKVDWQKPITKSYSISSALGGSLAQIEGTPVLNGDVVFHKDGSISFDLKSNVSHALVTESYSVSTKTTLMKVKETGFKEKIYSDEDFEKFGIFRNFQYRIGMQGDLKDPDIKKFAQVYNLCGTEMGGACSTNVVEMHLSKNMPEKYKVLSIKAIEAWNKLFQKALSRTDDVVVYNPTEVDIADARHNMIAYVDTNFKNGALLGVSQVVASPLTGETLTSRSTVFGDGVESSKAVVDRIIDSLLTNPLALQDFLFDGKHELQKAREALQKKTRFASANAKQEMSSQTFGGFDQRHLKKSVTLENAMQAAASSSGYLKNVKELVRDNHFGVKERLANLDPAEKLSPNYTQDIHSIGGAEAYMTKEQKAALADNLLGMQDVLLAGQNKELNAEARKFFSQDMEGNLSMFEKRQVNMAIHGIHGAELVEASIVNFVKASILKSLKKGLGSNLTDEQTLKELEAKLKAGDYQSLITILKLDFEKGSALRQDIKEEVGELVYYSTLLHELGHSFGLRHNFIASVDEKNFHPRYHEIKEELDACKTESGNCNTELNQFDLEAYAFSSVMDYNGGFHNDLQALGPYDHAAIQYAYNPAKPVQGDFQFCTDDHVADNVLCNRFDRGVNLSEITLNRIKGYQSRYFSSFFRRGRAFFGNPIGSLVQRYMLPIRTVMDEGIYQLINAKPATEAKKAQTTCASEPDAISNYRGLTGDQVPEFVVNTCKNAELEAFLKANNIPKKPTDLDAVEYAINFRKPINEFKPLSRADMVLSNVLAKGFFKSLLGSGEPGVYLPEQKDGKTILTKIPGVGPVSTSGGNQQAWIGAIQQGLAKMAEERNQVPNTFVNANIRKVTNIDIGIGKYFKSMTKESAGKVFVQNVGSIYEKYYAMMVLGTRHIGVPKYYRQSLTGNAYLWPHTREFAVDAFSKLIQKDPYISEINYSSIVGQPGTGYMAATQDVNTQNLASLFSVVFFINEQDKSFFRKVKVSHNVAECDREAKKIQGKKVKVEIQGQVLCAYDDFSGKSIVLPMLEKVGKASEDVQKYTEIINNMPSLIADAKVKVEKITSETMVQAKADLEKNAEGFDDLKKSVDIVTGDKAKGLVTAMPDAELFMLIELNKAMQQGGMQAVINPLAQIVQTRVTGGVPAFQKRVQEIMEGKIPRKETPATEEPVKEEPKAAEKPELPVEGFVTVDTITQLQALGVQVQDADGPAQAAVNPISDDQLTQLARFYLDLMDYMGVISGLANELVQVKASDVFLDRATSAFDREKAPLEELIKMVRIYGR